MRIGKWKNIYEIMKTIIFDLDGTVVDLSQGLCFADVKQLRKLCRKYRLALVTGASRKETLEALRRFGLDNFFQAEFIITKDEVSASKATGAPFRKIKKILNGPAIFIGDSKNDICGCRKARLPSILAQKSRNTKLQKANFRKALFRAIDKLESY